MNEEPTIMINEKTLTDGQAMTIRVALEHYESDLLENGLGDDAHGKSMVEDYCKNIAEIRSLIIHD